MIFETSFTTAVFTWQGKASWYFAALPVDTSQEIDYLCAGIKAGFGSLPVQVVVGSTHWQTSIFPDRKRGQYLLPLKAAVRRAEGIEEGSQIKVSLQI